MHGQSVVKYDTQVLGRIRNRDGNIVKLEREEVRKLRKSLPCASENGFGFVIIKYKLLLCHPVFGVLVTGKCVSQQCLMLSKVSLSWS